MHKMIPRLITNWMIKNLHNVENPKIYGKELKGLWRYRVGDYRLIAKINDNKLLVFMVEK